MPRRDRRLGATRRDALFDCLRAQLGGAPMPAAGLLFERLTRPTLLVRDSLALLLVLRAACQHVEQAIASSLVDPPLPEWSTPQWSLYVEADLVRHGWSPVAMTALSATALWWGEDIRTPLRYAASNRPEASAARRAGFLLVVVIASTLLRARMQRESLQHLASTFLQYLALRAVVDRRLLRRLLDRCAHLEFDEVQAGMREACSFIDALAEQSTLAAAGERPTVEHHA